MPATGTYETRIWTSRVDPRLSGKIDAFIPNLLHFGFRAGDSDALGETERLLARTAANLSLAPIGPTLTRSEGIASSWIEGLVMSTRRIYEARHSPGDVDDRSASQIVGNMNIMTEALSAGEQHLTIDDLHRWHRTMREASPQQESNIGAFRQEQNWIGGRVNTPIGAEFVPPPHEHVTGLMADLVDFANRTDLPPIVHAAVAHAQFESIHPYADGNGRVGRVLVYRILASRGVLGTVAPPISPIIVDDRESYIAGLTAYRQDRPDTWIDSFVSLLSNACAYSLLLATALTELMEQWSQQVSDVRAGSVDHKIVKRLTEHPVLDAPTVARLFGISEVAARDVLHRLVARDVLIERPLRRGHRGRPARVFEASHLFDLLDEPPRQLAARLQGDSG